MICAETEDLGKAEDGNDSSESMGPLESKIILERDVASSIHAKRQEISFDTFRFAFIPDRVAIENRKILAKTGKTYRKIMGTLHCSKADFP